MSTFVCCRGQHHTCLSSVVQIGRGRFVVSVSHTHQPGPRILLCTMALPVLNKNKKTLMAEDFHNLEEPFVKRNDVDNLRDLCLREGLPHAGTKPTLVERIMEAARAKQTEAVADVLDDPSGGSDADEDVEASGDLPDVATEVLSEEDVVQRISSMSPAQQDLMVGQHLRSLGGAFTEQYAGFLRAAIRANPMEIKGKLLSASDKDRYVPFRSTSWVWDHIHLRYSDEGSRWWCNHCAWDLPTGSVPKDHLGVKKFASGQTSNMESHLKFHKVTRATSEKVSKGELSPATAHERWSEEGQRRGVAAITKWLAKDKLAPNFGDGGRLPSSIVGVVG